MSAPLLAFVSIVYAYVSLDQCFKGNGAMAVVWMSYACANCALMFGNK